MDLQQNIEATIADFNLTDMPARRTAKIIMQLIKDDRSPQAAPEAVSAGLALLSGQLEAACKLIGTIADCPYCFFGWETDGCSDACNKFERGEGWECRKEYIAEQAT